MSIYEGNLDAKNLLSLAQGEIDVLVIDDYINVDTCKKMSAQLIDSGHDPYINAPSIGRVGMALYELKPTQNC